MNSSAVFWRDSLESEARKIGRPVQLMEVCGSHSFAVARFGIRALLPETVSLLSGPGCPVCVSGGRFIDATAELCRRGVKVALFGDLLRIPGDECPSLAAEPGLLVVYSPEEALDYAADHPSEEVVFAAVGFAPTLAAGGALLEEAARRGLNNFSMLSDFKNIRPVLDGLAADCEVKLDGFLLPGHVASIIGEAGFAGLARPGVISGFAAENILHSLLLLLRLIADGKNAVVNNYPELVEPDGNRTALALIERCFKVADGEWRGLGVIPRGCWRIREAYRAFDAVKKYDLDDFLHRPVRTAASGCRCADVLRGRIRPVDCPLFDKICNPAHPVGACMVSAEGACAAVYHYREVR